MGIYQPVMAYKCCYVNLGPGLGFCYNLEKGRF